MSLMLHKFEGRGEALRDPQGRFLCVPSEKVDGSLIVPETPEHLAMAYPMTEAELRAAPNGIHSYIRHVDPRQRIAIAAARQKRERKQARRRLIAAAASRN